MAGHVAVVPKPPNEKNGGKHGGGGHGHGEISILAEHDHHQHFKYVIHPDNVFRRYWDIGTTLWVLYLCWLIPFSLAFGWWRGADSGTALYNFSRFLDIWFGVDIILNFRTGFVHDGHLVMDPKEIRGHYFEFWFWIDILASIPFELFAPMMSKSARKSIKLVKYFKLPRLLRIGRILKYLRKFAKYMGVILTTFTFIFGVHFMGSFWIEFANPCPNAEAMDVGDVLENYNTGGHCSQENIIHIYAIALNWGVTTMLWGTMPVSSLPDGDWVTKDIPYIFSAFVKLFGCLVVSIFFGNMAMLIANFNLAVWEFRRKFDNIKHEMTNHGLPANLQYRISKYYDYLWVNGRYHEDVELLTNKTLPETLRMEIAVFMNRDLVSKVPFFRGATRDLISRVCLSLEDHIYIPRDWVFLQGSLGDEMYIMKKGKCNVLKDFERHQDDLDGYPKSKVGDLQAGDFFGEVALLQTCPRSVSVRASVMVETCGLTKKKFDVLCDQFPDFKESIRASSRQAISTPGRAKPVNKALQDARGRAEKAKLAINAGEEAKDDAQSWMNGVESGIMGAMEQRLIAQVGQMAEQMAKTFEERIQQMEGRLKERIERLEQTVQPPKGLPPIKNTK